MGERYMKDKRLKSDPYPICCLGGLLQKNNCEQNHKNVTHGTPPTRFLERLILKRHRISFLPLALSRAPVRRSPRIYGSASSVIQARAASKEPAPSAWQQSDAGKRFRGLLWSRSMSAGARPRAEGRESSPRPVARARNRTCALGNRKSQRQW